MSHRGGCQCGAVRYEVGGEPEHSSICHCTDCRKSAGAPFVAWAAFRNENFHVTGEVTAFNSSGAAMRHFCPRCGTGVYYINEEILPGLVDIQTATLDDPSQFEPDLHVQTAEQLSYIGRLEQMTKFERYPGM